MVHAAAARRIAPFLVATLCACTYQFDRDFRPDDAGADTGTAQVDAGTAETDADAGPAGCEGASDGTPCADGACVAGVCCAGCISPAGCEPGDVVEACGLGGRTCRRCSGEMPICDEGHCRVEHPIVEGAVGRFHTCMRDDAGRIYCQGSDLAGELGVRDPSGACTATAPLLVPLPMPARELRAEFAGTCAVLIDGSGWCWGEGLAGAGTVSAPSTCFDGTMDVPRTEPASIDPVRVVPSEPPFGWRSIATANRVRYGLNEDGVAFYWGDYDFDSSPPPDQPVRVPGTPPPFVALRADSQYALALDADGGLYSWGRQSPVAGATATISSEPLVRDVTVFTAGLTLGCWVYSSGSIECDAVATSLPATWEAGPLGGRLVPRGDSARVTSVAITYLSAMRSVCWTNDAEELWCDQSTAPELPIAGGFTDVVAGSSHFAAVDVAGRLWTWHIAEGVARASVIMLPPL